MKEMQPTPAVFQLVNQQIAASAWPTVLKKEKNQPSEIRVKSISKEEVNSWHSSARKSGWLGEITKGQMRINDNKRRELKEHKKHKHYPLLHLSCSLHIFNGETLLLKPW